MLIVNEYYFDDVLFSKIFTTKLEQLCGQEKKCWSIVTATHLVEILGIGRPYRQQVVIHFGQ